MKRMCAWCGRALDPAERVEDEQKTHGLCAPCRLLFFPTSKTNTSLIEKDAATDQNGRSTTSE